MNVETGAFGSAVEADSISIDAQQHGAKALVRGKDKLLGDLKTVADDAQALMKEAVDTSAENIAGVPAYLEGKLSAVRGNLLRARSAVGNKARHATAATDKYVKENPWKSMGYVTAATALIGILLVSTRKPAVGKTEGMKNEIR